MTKEEILAMKTGLDLNHLVCDKIFDNKTLGSVKHYSTDISAAWQVVEKMREGFSIEIVVNKVCHQIIVVFSRWDGKEWHHTRAWAKTAPEAVCKAALLAKREDEFLKTINPIKRMGIEE